MKKVALGAFVFLLLLSSFIFAQEIEVNGLMVTDVLNTTAKVSWSTSLPTGENTIYYRVKDATEWQEVALTGESDTHLETINDLTAGTTYELKVLSAGTESAVSEFTTLESLYGFTTPKMFTARVLKEDAVTASAYSLVYIQLRHDGDIISDFYIVAMTSETGWFSVDLSPFQKAGYSISAGDMAVITVNAGADGVLTNAVEVEISSEPTTVYDTPIVVKDTAAPQLISGRSYSVDSAYANRVELVFDESLQGTLPVGFTIYDTVMETNVTINSAEFVGNTIVFDIAGISSGEMTVSYDSTTGDISDNATTPNDLVSFENFVLTDEVATTIASVVAMDERNNTEGDYVEITFSEPVTINNYILESPSGSVIADIPTTVIDGAVVRETYGHSVLTVGQDYKVTFNVTEKSSGGSSFDLDYIGIIETNDTDAPVVEITNPANNSIFALNEVTISGTVSGEEDISVIEYNVNDEATWHVATTVDVNSFSFTLSDLTEGSYLVKVRGTDVPGNISNEVELNFSVDLTNPIVTLDTIDGSILSFPVTVTGVVSNAKDSGLKQVYYSIDNDAPTEWLISNIEINDNAFTITLVDELSDGVHIIYVKAEDNAGNMSEVVSLSFTVAVDTEAPILLSAEVSPAYVNETAQITLNFQDMPEAEGSFTGINHAIYPVVTVTPNEGDTVTVTADSYTDDTWVGTINVSALANGIAKVNIVSGPVDMNGNQMAALNDAVEFIIDTESPILSDITVSPENSSSLPANVSEFTFSGTVEDANDFEAVYYINDGASVPFDVNEDGQYNITVDFADLKIAYDETFTFTLKVTDEAGNISEGSTEIYFDITKPIIHLDPMDAIINSEEIIISGNVTDDAKVKGTPAFVEMKINDGTWFTDGIEWLADRYYFTYDFSYYISREIRNEKNV
jgi:hypothetical protein